MKIIYDTEIYNWQKHGGVSRYFSEIIPRIKKYDNAQVYIFKSLKGRLGRFNKILSNFRFSFNKFDIYHPTYYSSCIKRRKHVKTVVTVYDMIHELYLSKIGDYDEEIMIKKKSIYNADHIICISNNTKKNLQMIYDIDDKLISMVYLGGFLKSDNLIREKYTIPRKPYILYVGRRVLYKNFEVLLNAFYQLNIDRDFNLVCFGGGKFTGEELSKFKKLNLDSSVKYMDGPDGLLQFYYGNARVFIYPSFCEGFGLPIIEAMSLGCPVVASNISAIPEIAGDAALLFSPESPEELGNCINKMLNDNKMRDDYIGKGKNRSQIFSWDKTAQETLNVYKKILN